ncbi:hypothetical protein [Streptomyces xiaopingdaonensis]|uniref:hypothetical protein n=1 Tax=Streptomyces xiaopingdaonensis TaxID=1565415 RepID=UPI0002DCC66A|nr:hypothetical protein [Streptomyces xiaopingdaonensis]
MQGFSRKPGIRGPAEKGVSAAAEREVGRWGAVICVGGVVCQALPPMAETLGPDFEEVDASLRSPFGHKPPGGGCGHESGTRG